MVAGRSVPAWATGSVCSQVSVRPAVSRWAELGSLGKGCVAARFHTLIHSVILCTILSVFFILGTVLGIGRIVGMNYIPRNNLK